MAILLGLQSSPSRSPNGPRILFYCALVASIFCLWTVFAWYQGLDDDLRSVRQERDAAIKVIKAREYEQKTQTEEIRRLKEKYRQDMTEAQTKIDDLNATAQGIGYNNYDGGQLDGADEVVVVIKTGATELYKVLPIHLATTLNHVPNFLLFSDHEQRIGQYHIQDSLDDSKPESVQEFWDYHLYRDQQQYMAEGQNPDFLELSGGWELDKFKNVHILVKTYKQRPDAKWYLFIDADTYIVMANLLPFLRNLDHNEKLYFGSPTYIANLNFAHGGTGYVISHAAVKAVVESKEELAQSYEDFTKDQCCGDYVLARALKDNDIDLIWASPNFQGEPPYTMEFDKDKMCEPVVTLHHMLPLDVGEFWNFEQEKAKPGEYLLYADVYEKFVAPHLKDEIPAWDNMGGRWGDEVDIKVIDPHRWGNGTKPSAFDRCKQACKDKEDCVQFRTKGDECKITHHTMLGWRVPLSKDDKEDYHSGWLMNRVDELGSVLPCSQPPADWPKDKIK